MSWFVIILIVAGVMSVIKQSRAGFYTSREGGSERNRPWGHPWARDLWYQKHGGNSGKFRRGSIGMWREGVPANEVVCRDLGCGERNPGHARFCRRCGKEI